MALGCGSVKRFLQENDSEAITELMAFYQIEPFGQPWLQTGTVAASCYGAISGKAPSPKVFLPVKQQEERHTPEQMAAAFRMFAKDHNQRNRDGNNRKP